MTITVEVLTSYAADAAARLGPELRAAASIVLTGGHTAREVYSALPEGSLPPGADILFSDERCVPPDHAASNYGMAVGTGLLEGSPGIRVHRMAGEDEPEHAAARYHDAIAPLVASGIDVALLGLGADCHVASLFPRSSALDAVERLCVAVQRPDGLGGLTLTPVALRAARKVFVIASGPGKADAVSRLLGGGEAPHDCPGRLLAGLPDVTLLGDRDSTSSAVPPG